MIVVPFSHKLLNISKTFKEFLESKFPVGSSAKITLGLFIKALAIATLCL